MANESNFTIQSTPISQSVGEENHAAKRRWPVGLLVWWMVLLVLVPVGLPTLISFFIELFSKGVVVNSFAELIHRGDLLLAIELFACAVAFDAYVLKTRKSKAQSADGILLICLLIAGLVLILYPLFKIYGLPSSHVADHIFLWTNVVLYSICGVLALVLRWPDLLSAVNCD